MESNTLLTVIGGIIILALIIIALVIRLKSKPSAFDKEAAENFLKGLSDTFYDKMMEIINNIDLTSYDSFEQFEVSVLQDIYDAVWTYVSEALGEASKTDILTAMALKILNKEYVDKFVDKLLEDYQIEGRLTSIWSDNFKKQTSGIATEDSKLQQQFANSADYVEKSSEEDLPPAEQVVPTEEELAALNPPTEEEKEYDPEEDSSVEPIEDEEPMEDDELEKTFIDSRGRKRDKATGRYV